MKPESVLILTHKDKKTGEVLLPHYNFLLKSNPNINIHVIVGEDSPRGKRYNWRNGDKPLRKWWKENKDKVSGEVIAVIEYDTLVGVEFPSLPEGFDLVGQSMFVEPIHLKNNWVRKTMNDETWTQDNWYWWNEIPLLKLQEGEVAYGLVSFGCFLMRRWVLDAVCGSRWDNAYERDIVSELRFPSVAAAEGAKIGRIPLPYVHHSTMIYTCEKEIYHPIKTYHG